MTYKITFQGRKIGAIGITALCTISVQAESEEQAILKLYNCYEHIKVIKIETRK